MEARTRELYDLAVNSPDEATFQAGLRRLAERDVDEQLARLSTLRRRRRLDYAGIAEAARKLAAAANVLAHD